MLEIKNSLLGTEQTNIFNEYYSAASSFCDFLKANTGIEANALCESQFVMIQKEYAKLSLVQQKSKLENFQSYYRFCKDLVSKRQSLRDKKSCIKAFFYKYALTVQDQDEILDTICDNTFIEVYDSDFKQVYRSVDFFEVTSHSIMALELCEWFDLFQRSKDLTSDQYEVVTKIFSGVIKVPVYKPIEDHTVKEINSDHPKSSQAQIILYAPLFNADGTFYGILHLFRVIESQSLEFQLV